MPLTSEQISELKTQLKSQVQDLPPDKKAEAEKQIENMTPEALELMLQQQQSQGPQIYRQIVKGEIPTIKVGENKTSLAVLDNKPISKGHTVIIPKKQASTPQKIPKSSFKLAEAISKKITENLNAKSTKAHTETKFGEAIINLIPIYDKDLDINSPRSEATPKELEDIKSSLEMIKIKKEPKKIKIPKPKPAEVLKLKRRIP